jgi:hypothetical protein
VASSRIYVRIPHASDVVGGIAVGLVIGTVAKKAWPLDGPARHAAPAPPHRECPLTGPVAAAMPLEFAVTYDYRCPFAWRAHDHVLAALRAGADWDVRFVTFSLGQVHVEHGEPDIWDRPDDDTGLLALQASVAVRDHHPDQFLAVHDALFRVRTSRPASSRRDVVRVLPRPGSMPAVFTRIATGAPLETIRRSTRLRRPSSTCGGPHLHRGTEAAFVA